jgi:hypothetical protein
LIWETEVGRKPAPVPLFPSKIPHDVTWDCEKSTTNRLSYGTARHHINYHTIIVFASYAFCCSWRYIAIRINPSSGLSNRNTEYLCSNSSSEHFSTLAVNSQSSVPTSQLFFNKQNTTYKRKLHSYMHKHKPRGRLEVWLCL